MTDLKTLAAPSIEQPRKSRAKPNGKRGGRKRGQVNMSTRLRQRRAEIDQAKLKGEKLAVDYLRTVARECALNMAYYRPRNDNGEPRKKGDEEKWYRAANLLVDVAVPLAPYESQKLPMLAEVRTPQRSTEPMRMTVKIFDDKGQHEKTIIDGEVVEDNRAKLARRIEDQDE
jgi:hypothetical protein